MRKLRALGVLVALCGAFVAVSPAGAVTCADASLTFTGVASGRFEEDLSIDSMDSVSHATSLGSASCRIVSLNASMTSIDPFADLDLYVSWEGFELGSSVNPSSSEETVGLTDVYYGTWEFRVSPVAASNAPYTVAVTADLEPAAATSGANSSKPFVVIAVVDTGINPYHQEFRSALYPDTSVDLSAHPSTYIDEYPASSTALNLSLNASSYGSAVSADAGVWSGVVENKLYWIPGTKIIGAYDGGGDLQSGPRNILDEHGHGTASAGVAAGNTQGSCTRCLVVAVEGENGLAWALQQPWIDFVTNSWGSPSGIPDFGKLRARESDWTRAAVGRGQTVLFASGNGFENGFITPQPTLHSWRTGPEWIMTVGPGWRHENASNAYCNCSDDDGIILAGGRPVDVISYSLGTIPAPTYNSLNGTGNHSGTSSATPIVAGVMGDALRHARFRLNDFVEGNRGGISASGTPYGTAYLSDGSLLRSELEMVIKHTAEHTHSTWIGIIPVSPPTFLVPNEASFAQWGLEGWGIVLPRTGVNAKAILDGTQPTPTRLVDEAFGIFDKQIRDALWGPAQ